ncbi:histidine phosphatase family protein [Microbacterium sediminicola]|uniref:Histidine phosphatase family protein n=1 Tax=Microbacterium sediminicola TaxID=415210 RepID=A0ABP4U7Y5_9MICO
MPADRLHLVRHGEVFNPEHVLYGRLPGFRLSEDGRRMAEQAAQWVAAQERPIVSLVASPLQRTQESAQPFVQAFDLPVATDDRVIEPTNVFEGTQMRRALMNPLNWRHLVRPSVPSWGEPYAQVVARMDAAMTDAWAAASGGDVVIVSHQLPIWITHLAMAGEPTKHDPRKRRCSLSSVTSFERHGDTWREVGYAEPASTAGAVDVGAV